MKTLGAKFGSARTKYKGDVNNQKNIEKYIKQIN